MTLPRRTADPPDGKGTEGTGRPGESGFRRGFSLRPGRPVQVRNPDIRPENPVRPYCPDLWNQGPA